MKKILLILAFVLVFAFSLSLAAFAQETENTYYVVQSEDSDLAVSLTAEGKNVVGIEKLYSSKGLSSAEDSTYFVSLFDGKVLNLILAENVSYCVDVNPSDPGGSGIRLDKAVTLNVYFNGHYWWIPDDNRYAGFFINNQDAHLTLIGNRTLEEVQAGINLSNVNARTTSSAVDYYGGYISFYVETGDLTIKNAIIVGEDEVIYQKDKNASGTTSLTLDTCYINNKDKQCRTIFLKSEVTDITVEMNSVYSDVVSINNVMPDSYIKNSKMNKLYFDSWHLDTCIGKEYVYIENCEIGNYIAECDTIHIVATNTKFNSIDLNGDTSGGGFATLMGSSYSSLSLKRDSDAKVVRNGVVNVLTVADCVNAATKTVYTYSNSTGEIISSLDETYSKDNPALGHDTKGELLSISYTSYVKYGDGKYKCTVCGEEHLATGIFEPLFTSLGYSVFEGESGSFAVGYVTNREAIAKYQEQTGKTIGYGIFAVLKDRLGDKPIFNQDGTTADGVISANVTTYEFEIFELKIIGITEQRKHVKIAMGAYVVTTDGENKEYSYLQESISDANKDYSFVSYDEVLDLLAIKEVVSLEDVVIVEGTTLELAKTFNIRGDERVLTYSYEGTDISIDDYTLTGIVKKTETYVTVTARGFIGRFKVKVAVDETKIYKHVVIIGVDGAGAFFENANTPNIDSIFENGAITYDCLTADPTISAQCWGSLMHGIEASAHKLTNDIVSSTPYPNDSKYPSFFSVIRENDEDAILASFCNWNPINVGIVEDNIGVYKVGGISDSNLTAEILTYLEDNKPTAMFVQFDEADGVGHSLGYGSDSQLAKISQIDGYIGQIYEAYEQNGMLDETLFIVTSDHGGSGTNHGGKTDAEKYVMFAAAGKTVENGTIENMEIRDTAAVVLHALGHDNPDKWTAIVPSGLFEGVVAKERPVRVESGRNHVTEPTPTKDSEEYVTNFIGDHKLSTYLTFDGDVSDACGNTTSQGGVLSYEDGFYGQGVVLDNGYVSVKNLEFGTDSFTVALWLKTDGIYEDPCIFSNKNWQSGKNSGFAFAILNGQTVKFNFADGSTRADCEARYPSDYKDGWVHVMVIVDRKNAKIGVCVDFDTIVTVSLSDALKNDMFDTVYSLNIGQDGTGNYNRSLTATADEFMIFQGAFDAKDVSALAEYYGIDK